MSWFDKLLEKFGIFDNKCIWHYNSNDLDDNHKPIISNIWGGDTSYLRCKNYRDDGYYCREHRQDAKMFDRAGIDDWNKSRLGIDDE